MTRPAVTLRLARTDEREALEALQWRASLANAGDREALLAHPDAIELPTALIEGGQVVIAEADGETAGFAAVLPREDGALELDGLFVEPGLWKSGVGRALVERCCEMGRERGAGALHVVGNPHAEGFYKSCGFETTGLFETRFGPGLIMRRDLGET